MSRIVIIDADVIGHINRGNAKAAQALRGLIESGATVYVSQQAYNELTGQPGKLSGSTGPDLPRTAAGNRKLLEDLGIRVAPAGKLADRAKVYDRNISKPSLSDADMMTVAQVRAIPGAQLWSFDKSFRKDPANAEKAFGIRVAAESRSAYEQPVKIREDYRVARSLMRLPAIEITVSGQIVRPTPKKPPSTPGSSGGPGGTRETKVSIGTQKFGPIDVDLSNTRGQKIGNAVELGLRGVNFLVQKINDSIQQERLKKEWDKVKPNIERKLAEDPSMGVLIMIRFGRRRKQGAEHESPLEHTNQFLGIDTSYGYTEDEAWEAYRIQPRLSTGAGLDVSIQRQFISPRTPVDIRKLRTPFTAYGLGTFVPGRESLMKVAWKGIFGFDEIGDIKLSVPPDVVPRFLLLVAPNEIMWFNGSFPKLSDVPIDWRNAASVATHYTRPVSVVDMDRGLLNVGNDSAAMVFPADGATMSLFSAAGQTKDPIGQLKTFVNFKMMRWVRPENIHILRKFMEDKEPGSYRPVRSAPKEPPLMR